MMWRGLPRRQPTSARLLWSWTTRRAARWIFLLCTSLCCLHHFPLQAAVSLSGQPCAWRRIRSLVSKRALVSQIAPGGSMDNSCVCCSIPAWTPSGSGTRILNRGHDHCRPGRAVRGGVCQSFYRRCRGRGMQQLQHVLFQTLEPIVCCLLSRAWASCTRRSLSRHPPAPMRWRSGTRRQRRRRGHCLRASLRGWTRCRTSTLRRSRWWRTWRCARRCPRSRWRRSPPRWIPLGF